jgi:hypothetical protein
MDKFLASSGMSSMIESRVTEFRLEVMKKCRLSSTDCDEECYRKFLFNAYEVAKAIPIHEFQFLSRKNSV